MTSFRLWAISAVTLVTVGWLQADTIPVDPLIKFKTGGGGSTNITCNISGCITLLSPNIGADGQATLDIFNRSGLDINQLTFFIPTNNFNQLFEASTDAFIFAFISPDEFHSQLQVVFIGVGNALTGGTASLGPDPGAPGDGLPGFTVGGTVTVQSFFGSAPPGSTFPGFLNNAHGTLTLSTVPEPSVFWTSLIGVAGLLVARRRVRSK